MSARKILWLCCLCCATLAQAAPWLTVVTEDAPPYNFVDGGRLQGPAPTLVAAILQRAGLPYQQHVYPWARSYAMASHEPNVLIYALARTSAREKQFHWIGRLVSERYALYTQSSRHDLQVSTLAQARSLRLGVSNQDVRTQWLREQGFKDAGPQQYAGLDVSDSNDTNLRKLQRGWIDAVPVSAAALSVYCQRMATDCRQFRLLMPLGLTVDLYLAASLDTAPATVTTLQNAYQSLQRDGSVARAFHDYQ